MDKITNVSDNLLDPLYFEPGNNFNDFLKKDYMINYKKNFLSKPSIKLPEKTTKKSIYEYINNIIFRLLETEKKIHSKIGLNFSVEKDLSNMQKYYNLFNTKCKQYFLPKKDSGDTNNFNNFILDIWNIIEKKGIKITSFEEVIYINPTEKKQYKNLYIQLNNYGQAIRDYMVESQKNISSATDKLKKAQDSFENALGLTAKTANENFLYEYLNLNKESLILQNQNLIKYPSEYWDKLFKLMYPESSKYFNYAMELSGVNTFLNVGNVKGQFFEDFFEKIVLKLKNRQDMSSDKIYGAAQEKILFQGKDYGKAPVDIFFGELGFQLKSGSSISPYKLYEEQNIELKLNNIENFRFLETDDWINFATLLELSSDINGNIIHNKNQINTFLLKIEEYQLRISTNQDFVLEINNDIKNLSNSIYLVNGNFYPASYLLYRRFKKILNQKNKVESYKLYGKLKYTSSQQERTFCYINDFNKTKNLLNEIVLKRSR